MFPGRSSNSDGSVQSGDLSDENLALYEEQRWGRDGEGKIPYGVQDGVFKDVHFEFDSSNVSAQGQENIKNSAQALKADDTLFVEVEGHCDSRGTSEYNFALGEQRARAVKKLLEDHGIAAKRVSTVSYGEEIPVSKGEGESDFAKNRRAHFAVYRLKN